MTRDSYRATNESQPVARVPTWAEARAGFTWAQAWPTAAMGERIKGSKVIEFWQRERAW